MVTIPRRRILRRLPVVLWVAIDLAAAGETGSRQTSRPADARPHVAVTDFRMAANTDVRDRWMSVALQEMIAWRLRRVDAIITVPTARLAQTQRELEADGERAIAPADTARMLGARHIVSGTCTAGVRTVSLDLTLSSPNRSQPETTGITAERLFDVLDQATGWVLDRLGASNLDEATRRLVFAAPAKTASAVEYYAKAVQAAHAGKVSDIAFYLRESGDSDPTFRETINLRARLGLTTGRAGRLGVAQAAEALQALARQANDTLDAINAEFTQGVLAVLSRQPDAAMDRFESALAKAYERRDPYMQIGAVGHLCDLLLAQTPPQVVTHAEQRSALAREYLRRAAEWQAIHLSLVTQLGDLVAKGPSAGKLALIYEQLERWDAALAMHKLAVEAARQTGLSTAEAGAWMLLGRFHSRREQWSDALEAMSRCLTLAGSDAQSVVRVALAGIYEGMDMPAEALGEYQIAYEQVGDGDDLPDQFVCLSRMAELHKRLGRRADAVAALQEAVDIAHVLKLPEEAELSEKLEQWRSQAP